MGFIASLVISVISVLTLFALGLGLIALTRLKREAILLNLIDTEQKKTPPSTLTSAWGIVQTAFAQNGKGRDYGSSVVVTTIQDALLANDAEIEVLSVRRWLHWPRYLAGMFVFIGLLGTVWGMAAAVSGLGDTVALTSNVAGAASSPTHSSSSFTIDQWSKLLSGIDSLLAGMKIAFRCTLFGLFATVIVSALNSFYVSRCEIFEAGLQRLISTTFLPLKQNVDKAGSVSEQVERLGAVVDKFDSTAGSLSSSLNPVAKKLLTVAEKAEALTGQLTLATTEFREEARLVAQRNKELRDAISQGFSQVEKVVDKSYSQVKEILAEVAALPVESYSDLCKSAEALKATADELAVERSAFSETTKTVNASAVRMESAVSQLTINLTDAQKESNKHQSDLVEQFKGTHNSLDKLVRRFESSLNDVAATSSSAPLREELRQLKEELEKLRQVVTTAPTVAAASSRPVEQPSYTPFVSRNGHSNTASAEPSEPIDGISSRDHTPSRIYEATPPRPGFVSPTDQRPTQNVGVNRDHQPPYAATPDSVYHEELLPLRHAGAVPMQPRSFRSASSGDTARSETVPPRVPISPPPIPQSVVSTASSGKWQEVGNFVKRIFRREIK